MSDEAAPDEPGFLARIDGFAQRHAVIAFPYGVIKKFGDDRGGYLAALVSYYGFFSLFPLLLVFVTVLGYVLAGHPGLREDIVDSAFSQFPVIGSDSVSALEGNLFALIFGSLTALWAGLGAMQAMEHAMNSVWGVSPRARPNFLVSRLRALAMLAVIGGGIAGVTALGAVGTATAHFGVLSKLGITAGAVVLATGLFLLSFKVLTNRDLPWRAHLPGAVVGGVLHVVLQILGGAYISRVVNGAEDTYGVFNVVIGLLTWMFLQAQFSVYAAEVNVVRHGHLWPRALPGGRPTDVDRRLRGELRPEAPRERGDDGDGDAAARVVAYGLLAAAAFKRRQSST